jgi:hypothetical protein
VGGGREGAGERGDGLGGGGEGEGDGGDGLGGGGEGEGGGGDGLGGGGDGLGGGGEGGGGDGLGGGGEGGEGEGGDGLVVFAGGDGGGGILWPGNDVKAFTLASMKHSETRSTDIFIVLQISAGPPRPGLRSRRSRADEETALDAKAQQVFVRPTIPYTEFSGTTAVTTLQCYSGYNPRGGNT